MQRHRPHLNKAASDSSGASSDISGAYGWRPFLRHPLPPCAPIPPDPAPPPAGSEEPPDPPEFRSTPRPWAGRDRLGLTQTFGGLVLGLIALFSYYDHITFAGRNVPLQQQWGIPLIAASVATVFVDAQLATGSRLRAAHESEVDRD
jgi:hypothetical protein